jgi:PTS system fructose-specific IIA component
MDISNLLKDESIFINLDVASQDECLDILIEGMKKSGSIGDKSAYLESVLEREKKGSTGVGFGVAIPHGKSDGVIVPGLAFARLANPIDWNSLDGKPVEIVFLIGVPQKDTGNEHLKILVAISRKLIHQEFREKLLNVKTSGDVLEILKSI